MPFVPVPGTIEVGIIYTDGESQMENVYHVFFEGEWDMTAIATLAGVLVDWLVDHWADNAAATIRADKFVFRDISADGNPTIEVLISPAVFGDLISLAASTILSPVIVWTTALAGRAFRGRTSHIGMTESMMERNNLEETFRSSLEDAYVALPGMVEAVGMTLGVASKQVDGEPRSPGLLTPITGVQVRPIIGSQVRRKQGRGV